MNTFPFSGALNLHILIEKKSTSIILGKLPEMMIVGQFERFDQVPSKPTLRIKITEHLENLIAVIIDCVQSKQVGPGCFVLLTAFSFQPILAVFSNKRQWT